MMTEGSVVSSPCEMHAPDRIKKGQGSNESVNGSANVEASEGTYVVVTRSRNGTRNQKNGGTPIGQVQ